MPIPMSRQHLLLARFYAARRMELARQVIRECGRYGFTVTAADQAELHLAEIDYDTASNLLGV